ncbi:MAG: RsmB/NOP family class I SAM-dependent RNA methyltransferase [Coriobacteriales bacterium]
MISGARGRGHVSPARVLALQATSQVRQRDAYAKQVVERLVEDSGLPEHERAFATLLTYGVVSASGTLDEIIDANLRHPRQLKDDVRDCLRISTYEIVFLKKSPYAAVDQGVELVRMVAPKASGLANAVLRKISESANGFPWGDPATDVSALARKYGFPEWIVRRSLSDRGRPETLSMLEASAQEKPPLFLAANPFLVGDEKLKAHLSATGVSARGYGVAGCFVTSDSTALVRHPVLGESMALVSDAAAQTVAVIATPHPGEPFLEVGSGRGTKTILLQGSCVRHAHRPARIFALDVHGFKTDVLEQRLARFHVPGVKAVTGDVCDLSSIEELPEQFSGCLVDAPCSGLGTLRRHPEQRWRVRPEQVSQLACNGLAMLQAVAGRIAPGGFVVYSTCTFTLEEDERVVERFLESEQGAGFHVESVAGLVPADLNDAVTPEGYFRTMPRRGGPDGHFAARLVRS